MKIFAVLASFICAVYCSGGLHEQDASTFPRYLDMALNELGLTQEAGSGIKVVGVRTQVVAGINTYIDLTINGHPCRMVIWDQSWTHKHQVTTDTCTTVLSAGKRQLGGMPGGWSPVRNMNDAEVQKALVMAVDAVNSKSNSMYRLTLSQIVSVKQQVVAGMNYNITMILSPSTCLNNQANQHLMASRCPVDANSAMTPITATAIVWSKPWQNFMQVSSLTTQPGRVVTLIPATQEDIVWGVAFEIDKEDAESVRSHLDHRERGGYTKETVTFYPEDKKEKEIILDLYIGTEDNPNYLGPAPLDDIAHTIYNSVGPSGKNIDYLMNLTHALRTLLPEKDDTHLSELEARVKEMSQKNGHHI